MGLLKAVRMSGEYCYERWNWRPRNELEDENVTGNVVVITGSNTGIGKATAYKLAKKGAIIVLACRNFNKGLAAANEIKLATGNDNLEVMKLDLSSIRSCKSFCSEFEGRFNQLHILINNAGVFGTKRTGNKLTVTEDGFEPHLGINYFGHFLLTRLLLPILKRTTPSRIICVSSAMYLMSNLNVHDGLTLPQNELSSYWGHLGYSNSKCALILFTRELSKKLEGTGVRTYAVCPGIVETEMHQNQENFFSILLDKFIVHFFGFGPNEGCETILHCAVSRQAGKDSGKMYRFNKEWILDSSLIREDTATILWDTSSDIFGLSKII